MKTNRLTLLLVIAVAACALTGCSSDDNPAAPSAPAHAETAQDGSLTLTVGTDKASYAFGEDVVVTLSLRNTGNSPVALDFLRGDPARYPNLTLNIKSASAVAHFVEGDGTADKTTLGAGQDITYSWVWDQNSRLSRQPVDRGVYEVVGVVGFDDRDALRVAGLFIELK